MLEHSGSMQQYAGGILSFWNSIVGMCTMLHHATEGVCHAMRHKSSAKCQSLSTD